MLNINNMNRVYGIIIYDDKSDLIFPLVIMNNATVWSVTSLFCALFLGSMCVCYTQPLQDKHELLYTVVLVHKGVSVLAPNSPPPPICYCLFYSFYLEHTETNVFFLTSCRLQQEVQGVSGQWCITTESHPAPSALHSHRSLRTQIYIYI